MDDTPVLRIPVRSPTQLGLALRRIRGAKGMTQAQLARLANTRQPTVSSVEAGAPGTELATIFSLLTSMDLELVVIRRRRAARSPKELLSDE